MRRLRLRMFNREQLYELKNKALTSFVRAVRPNPSLEPTRYGRLCKPGLRYAVHFLSPGLQSLPPRAAQLER
jgi:hypothetical protein